MVERPPRREFDLHTPRCYNRLEKGRAVFSRGHSPGLIEARYLDRGVVFGRHEVVCPFLQSDGRPVTDERHDLALSIAGPPVQGGSL
jgi:hypothetical protein